MSREYEARKMEMFQKKLAVAMEENAILQVDANTAIFEATKLKKGIEGLDQSLEKTKEEFEEVQAHCRNLQRTHQSYIDCLEKHVANQIQQDKSFAQQARSLLQSSDSSSLIADKSVPTPLTGSPLPCISNSSSITIEPTKRESNPYALNSSALSLDQKYHVQEYEELKGSEVPPRSHGVASGHGEPPAGFSSINSCPSNAFAGQNIESRQTSNVSANLCSDTAVPVVALPSTKSSTSKVSSSPASHSKSEDWNPPPESNAIPRVPSGIIFRQTSASMPQISPTVRSGGLFGHSSSSPQTIPLKKIPSTSFAGIKRTAQDRGSGMSDDIRPRKRIYDASKYKKPTIEDDADNE